MTKILSIKSAIITAIKEVEGLDEVAGFALDNPQQFPSVNVFWTGSSEDYETLSKNRVVYSYSIMIIDNIRSESETKEAVYNRIERFTELVLDKLRLIDVATLGCYLPKIQASQVQDIQSGEGHAYQSTTVYSVGFDRSRDFLNC